MQLYGRQVRFLQAIDLLFHVHFFVILALKAQKVHSEDETTSAEVAATTTKPEEPIALYGRRGFKLFNNRVT